MTDSVASRQTRAWLTTAVAVSATATVAVAVVPFLRFAYANVSLHVALETSEAMIGALLTYLALGRFRITRSVADLVLAGAFGTLAATNLLLATTPNVLAHARAADFTTWAAAGCRLLAAGGIATAARLAFRPGRRPTPRQVALAVAGGVVAVMVLSAVADATLGDAIDRTLKASASSRPALVGHPLLLTTQLAAMLCYAAAAWWFSELARRGDPLRLWLAVGCVLAASSRVHYFLFASLYTTWVSTGDVLRFASYCAFLGGAACEIGAYWRAQAELGATEERRRVARDLHDGLAQELSFIRSQTAGRDDLDRHTTALVGDAAGRALLESRRLIRALHGPSPDLVQALHDAAEVVAGRAGADVDVTIDLSEPADVPPTLSAALVRVTREAAGNAVRHGRARHVTVSLETRSTGGLLRIVDDGRGFDASVPTEGFGLETMRARAREIGGTLDVISDPPRGTVVELRWR